MDQATATIITTIAASVLTGIFTLRASFGAQNRAAGLMEKHRGDDLKLAENRAQLRAVADFLRAVTELHSNWRNKQSIRLLDPIPPENIKHAALDAVNDRNIYLNALQLEAETLHLYIHNENVAFHIKQMFDLLQVEFNLIRNDYLLFPHTDDPDQFQIVRTKVLNEYDRTFSRKLRKCTSSISTVSRAEFGKPNVQKSKGLFTSPSHLES